MLFFEFGVSETSFQPNRLSFIILRHGFARYDLSYYLDVWAISIFLTLLSIFHRTIHHLYVLHEDREGKLLSNICLLELERPTVI